MALGDRRANAARNYLISAGISPARVRTISYGEERPADAGHDEAAWTRNRRAEFVIEE
jgi:peptidoglycan-associated lipoprotein